jgi:hypothetical protein
MFGQFPRELHGETVGTLSPSRAALRLPLCPPYGTCLRHCERSEAIQSQEGSLDCFVASAPRNDGPRD